jgi:hypothetical protein
MLVAHFPAALMRGGKQIEIYFERLACAFF